MPTVKSEQVVYTGPSSAVEGAGFLFPIGEPVEVPGDLAKSLTARGDFVKYTEKGDNA